MGETAAFSGDIHSLFAFIYSFTALREWLKLLVIGGALETCRRLVYHCYNNLFDAFFITADFSSDDMTGRWLLYWLSSLPQWHNFRKFAVSSAFMTVGDEEEDAMQEREGICVDGAPAANIRKVSYFPSFSTTYRFWYKGRWISIQRTKEEDRWATDKSTIRLTILSRNRKDLDVIIAEARRIYRAWRNGSITIYMADSTSSEWQDVSSRPKRPLNSIILDAGVRELIFNDAKDFLRSKKWYTTRGIPFRRGYLLYGAPGSGKTSLIHGLAGELGLDIYNISLSKAGLDDSALHTLISALPERCIALMEDIDAAFTHGLTRETAGTELDSQGRPGGSDKEDDERKPGVAKIDSKDTRITLSGLLNALDGISAQEGRLLFATTNRYTVLDPALIRPGRMDVHVEFRLASQYQAREMFRRFFIPDDSELEPPKEDHESEKAASGVSSKPSSTGDLIDLSNGQADKAAYPSPTPSRDPSELDDPMQVALSMEQIDSLAARFAEAIPERVLSMASLQGYLMTYKTRPTQAVEDVAQWVCETTNKRP
ncbi:P-loop containing nucleoside triphosphate hydrolase protein [Dentipellis sp. KUC8613]|nr:P-loop containing nucleoside triphosphate hydrolase protein [Dentipellis sp. KUC8613]